MFTILRAVAATSLAVGLTASGALSAPAIADTVTRTPYDVTGSSVVTTLCSFPVTMTSTINAYLTDHAQTSGGETLMVHGTSTDGFSANGHTLTGLTYPSSIALTVDAQGNPIRFALEGIIERVPLPGGGEFFTAGRIDILANLDRPDPVLNPDFGRMVNLAELCAALA